MIAHIIERHWITLHSLIVIAGLATYVIGSHTLHQRRHPAAAVAWIICLALLPYVTLPIYLIFGSRKLVDHAPPRLICADSNPTPGYTPGAGAQQLAAAFGLPCAATYERLHVHENGTQAWLALRDGIQSARVSLDVCTFILGRDILGRDIEQLLIHRARAGVRVRLLLDGIGRYLGGALSLRRLKHAGVEVALFVPPLHSPLRGRTNLRNHRKMVVADGKWLWCGGRNLAAEYFEGKEGEPPWTDLSFDTQGPLALEARDRFEQDWDFAQDPQRLHAPPPALPSILAPPPGDMPIAQLIPSGPDQSDDTVYTVLVSSCFAARERILMVTPYFVPDPTLMMALTLAARRGVAVDLLLPRKSNHRLADVARHRSLRELAASGGRIWFAPHMVHAKAIIIDTDLALVGSANLDARSLFLNYEMMVAFFEATDVERFAAWVTRQRSKAIEHNPQPASLGREVAEGLVLWVAFQL